MRCAAVQKRLVAWQDQELAPGEAIRVTEHLARCQACGEIERRLATVDDLEPLEVPPEIRARLHARTHVDLLLEASANDQRRSPFPAAPYWQRTLYDGVEVPQWTLLAAAAALVLLSIWGVQTQIALSDTQAELAARANSEATVPASPPGELRASDFQPASYQPGEEQGYR